MSLETKRFEFEGFVLDPDEKVLLRQDRPVQITPKIFKLLLTLVENHDHIVEKGFLMDKVWPDSFVEESNLTFSIRQLRKILGDDKLNPRFIETIPRRGYRFIASIQTTAVNGYAANGQRVPLIAHAVTKPWHLRPIFTALLVVLIGAAVLSAGAFLWQGGVGGSDKPSAEAVSNLKFETLVKADHPMCAALSPDGKYVAYARTANGLQGLWLQQLSSGVNTQIVPPEEGMKYFLIRFSPDGEYVYFSRSYKNDAGQIDRVSVLGGNVKTNILTGNDGAFSISPDHRFISFRRYDPEKRTLRIADINGGNERVIFETDKTFTDNVFSPDGKTIAFASGQSDTGDSDFGVYTIDVETGESKAATDHKWYHVRSIAWLPDQTGLLITASDSAAGSLRLSQISFFDGSVKSVMDSRAGFSTISATRDLSKILLVQVVPSFNLYVAASSALDDLKPLAEAYSGLAWAPDGSLVYGAAPSGSGDIWKISADKKTQKQLTAEQSTDVDPKVSPDGRYIVFTSDRGGKYNIWRMDADGSNAVALTYGEGEKEPGFTPDGAFVTFSSMKNRGPWKVPIGGGEPVPISENRARNISISPDGKKFAHFAKIDGKPKIVVRSFDNSQVLQQFDTPAGYSVGGDIVWFDKDKALIYTAEDNNNVSNLWGQSLDGGPPEKLTNYTTGEISSFAFSPDRSEAAFVKGGWNYEAVLLTGLKSPAEKN